MSSMLEQAIIDANSLREAAVRSAENVVLEKYTNEFKTVLEGLLEQDEDELDLGDLGLGGEEEDDSGLDALANLAGDDLEDTGEAEEVDGIPPASAGTEKLCPCPDDDEEVELEFTLDDLKKMAGEIESGEEASHEDLLDNDGPLMESTMEVEQELEMDEACGDIEDDDEELEIVEEEIEEDDELEGLDEAELRKMVEELIVDIKPEKRGWAGTPEPDMAEFEEMGLAQNADTDYKEENDELKDSVASLEEKLKVAVRSNNKLTETINLVKERFDKVTLVNVRLHYENRILNNGSLNEKQKHRIVEAIKLSDSVEEAKVIYETLQSAVGSPRKRTVESLNEAIVRPSYTAPRSKKEVSDKDVSLRNHWQTLAGIKKD